MLTHWIMAMLDVLSLFSETEQDAIISYWRGGEIQQQLCSGKSGRAKLTLTALIVTSPQAGAQTDGLQNISNYGAGLS